ncbi:MAG: capsid assembly protein, partial [Bacteroidales bacterium]|nr:capsid assembly protein [Bacteroidales bacterium]
MVNEQQSQNVNMNNQAGGDQLGIRDYIDMFVGNLHWFVLSVVVCVSLALLYLRKTEPTYQRQAVMLVKDDKAGSRGSQELQALSELSVATLSNSVDNEVYILRSFMLMQEVVRRLNLNVTYKVKEGWMKTKTLYYNAPLQVWTDTDPTGGISLKMQLQGDEKVRVWDVKYNGKKMEMDEMLSLGDTIQTPVGNLMVNKLEDSPYSDKEIIVGIGNIESTTNGMLGKLTTGLLDKKSTLIQLTLKEGNIARADAVLNMLLKVYSENIVEDKNRIAAATGEFINERVKLIAAELGDVETKLTEFKQQNKLVDIRANSSLYLQEGSRAKDETVKLEAQLTVAQYLRDYLQDVSKQYELIPNISNTDASLSSEVNAYNQKMMQRNRLVANSGEQNAVVLDLNTELNALRSSIQGSLQ